MSNPAAVRPAPPDHAQRESALDASRSILVQAPAGSGKTDLLTRRFLRLLAEVDEPGQIVAITFTNAAAAEMRHRILSELEKAAATHAPDPAADEFSMQVLARRALQHSQALGWQLLDLPAQLRISTIDSFCRDLALQQPLLTQLGGELGIHNQPAELYRRAARRTLERIGGGDPALNAAIEALLLWRDNGWQEMENLLVEMLGQRDRWMHEFVLEREPDWVALRERFERPFAKAVRESLNQLNRLLALFPGAQDEAVLLARFAFEQSGGALHQNLAELADFPPGPFTNHETLEEARHAFLCMANLVLTKDGSFRQQVNKRQGFPTDRKLEKIRHAYLIQALHQVDGLEDTLAAVRDLPPARYSEEDWQIVQSCFTLLRHAAGELRTVFAETGSVDFIEVAQIALHVLEGEGGYPSDAALAVADGIRHLLVDEFQDTSRRQHQLLSHLIAAWPETAGRTCFVVGDPVQSIYSFRDADAELFPRVKTVGLEIPASDPLIFDFVPLTANFRTAPALVQKFNEVFDEIFSLNDTSDVRFAHSIPARDTPPAPHPYFSLHLEFVPQIPPFTAADPLLVHQNEAAHAAQIQEIVALIRSKQNQINEAHLARSRGEDSKYRIAVLGRARTALEPVAAALREAGIPFRAVELEQLKDRPEVLDALALSRALLNPQDRNAWLGVLRAPWCALALDDLHKLVSADDADVLVRPVPELLAERLDLLSADGRRAAARVLNAIDSAPALRATLPTASLGTWLQQVWLSLGGTSCVDATAHANLDLLWSCLDGLPGGEQDLLSPVLDAALEKLTALPDPGASSECGVQLMTIHKSKGLEFELVIVPELQAPGGRSTGKLLSWLERGLAQPDGSGDITEFLVAPLQSKGAERSKVRVWVDRVRRDRESEEAQRILYVAATRAREELHFFARPAYKDRDGSLTLVEPNNNLLATAWPAFEDEVNARFEDWKSSRTAPKPSENQLIEAIAASGESNLLVMPSPAKPAILRRLPSNFEPSAAVSTNASTDSGLIGMGDLPPYTRHEGGQLSRAMGNAVHTLLEKLARLRTTHDWTAARAALARLQSNVAAQIRAVGAPSTQAGSIAAKAFEFALKASEDPYGQWILSPHTDAASEASWAGIVAGGLRTVRVDRIFRAGLDPLSEGDDAWWIVDYKTAHADNLSPSASLPELRKLFAPQLESYAEVIRNLYGKNSPIRLGLYYPRMLLLDWWEI
jgi:ATP-dependent exoDNAse (exonuclease V) beta subunit